MSKKPFVYPGIILKAENKELKEKNSALERKYNELLEKHKYLIEKLYDIVEDKVNKKVKEIQGDTKFEVES